MRRVEFLTRRGCGVCEAALPQVRRVCRVLRRRLVTTEITTNPDLEEEFHLRIPVLRDGDGRVLAEGTLGWREVLGAVWRS